MKLSYKMSKQEWKDLFDYLRTIPGVYITHFATTDNYGYFVDFCYMTIEYNGNFYYLQDGRTSFDHFSVCRYLKISPYEKQQNEYPQYIYSIDDLWKYMNYSTKERPLSKTYKQRIYLVTNLYTLVDGKTHLWRLKNELAGYKEKEVLDHLVRITMEMHTEDYCVLRFHSEDGNYFDYETKSRRITG